jgi:hypothetical protein
VDGRRTGVSLGGWRGAQHVSKLNVETHFVARIVTVRPGYEGVLDGFLPTPAHARGELPRSIFCEYHVSPFWRPLLHHVRAKGYLLIACFVKHCCKPMEPSSTEIIGLSLGLNHIPLVHTSSTRHIYGIMQHVGDCRPQCTIA